MAEDSDAPPKWEIGKRGKKRRKENRRQYSIHVQGGHVQKVGNSLVRGKWEEAFVLGGGGKEKRYVRRNRLPRTKSRARPGDKAQKKNVSGNQEQSV